MREIDDIRADWTAIEKLGAWWWDWDEDAGALPDSITILSDRLASGWNDIPDLLQALNTAQCAHAFVADSLSYETKRFREILAEKDGELRAVYGRIEKAEYGMVGGNLVQEAISYQCVSDWMRYITTGKEMADEN